MNDGLLFALTLICALGCGVVGGVFFAFSTFVMRALGKLPPAQGLAAMQSINVVVLNPLFLGTLFGTGLVCVPVGIMAITRWSEPGAGYLLAGGLLYVIGTVLETIVVHVPRNNALATLDPEAPGSAERWFRYASVWTAWNHVRTLAAIAASAMFILALAA
ncbi:anthrone oxygenase family protein [Amycolatopsis aidingensis]|uniref:anthrone oxygenase family protein n=1 Tax=Amycolatopsis aidingensis TaxID=2842453 RepID=UPI001C0B8291|nr:anthrone oxygenase family protein [Amycolatopsis aidingensis]